MRHDELNPLDAGLFLDPITFLFHTLSSLALQLCSRGDTRHRLITSQLESN